MQFQWSMMSRIFRKVLQRSFLPRYIYIFYYCLCDILIPRSMWHFNTLKSSITHDGICNCQYLIYRPIDVKFRRWRTYQRRRYLITFFFTFSTPVLRWPYNINKSRVTVVVQFTKVMALYFLHPSFPSRYSAARFFEVGDITWQWVRGSSNLSKHFIGFRFLQCSMNLFNLLDLIERL